ncbi:gp124 [Bacillus phage G]|uniref:thymidylate synthase n=1 Tax=Bacillus phage G TaxID=2884420 RepID=G3MBI6_9CAUD|nr:gp124 [Bacillus phage G]AEO93386.1 gp124 [Bacillus phage G]
MSNADIQYNKLVSNILLNGLWDKDQEVRTRWKDGTSAYSKSIIGAQFKFDNSEVPILTTKEVKWEAAIKEILWIWKQKSNVVQDLKDVGVNIWNDWELADGTIGKAYGYQLGKKCLNLNGEKVDQVDYLLHNLKNTPASRRHITTLWSIEDLNDMSLTPCVWKTQWFVKQNKLHLIVEARSSDTGLGLPFNIFQYNVLQRVFAQVLGYELGDYVFNIGDAHIYERHIEPLTSQLELPQHDVPTLWINPEKKNFYDFDISDFKLIGYEHGPFIRLPIAI